MKSLNGWRAIAIVSMLGWAATAIALVAPAEPARPDTPDMGVHDQRSRGVNRRTPRRRALSTRDVELPSSPPVEPDLGKLKDEVRHEVLEELEREREARRAERSARHLDRLLDDVAWFAEQYHLEEDTEAELQSAVSRLHDELEELRPPGPPGPGGPPPEVLEELHLAFDAFRTEVDELLEPDVADAFTDQMTPRPLRGRRATR